MTWPHTVILKDAVTIKVDFVVLNGPSIRAGIDRFPHAPELEDLDALVAASIVRQKAGGA